MPLTAGPFAAALDCRTRTPNDGADTPRSYGGPDRRPMCGHGAIGAMLALPKVRWRTICESVRRLIKSEKSILAPYFRTSYLFEFLCSPGGSAASLRTPGQTPAPMFLAPLTPHDEPRCGQPSGGTDPFPPMLRPGARLGWRTVLCVSLVGSPGLVTKPSRGSRGTDVAPPFLSSLIPWSPEATPSVPSPGIPSFSVARSREFTS